MTTEQVIVEQSRRVSFAQFTLVRMDSIEKHANHGALWLKETHNLYAWPCTSRLKSAKQPTESRNAHIITKTHIQTADLKDADHLDPSSYLRLSKKKTKIERNK